MSYLRAPVNVNVDDLIGRALGRIAEQIPGWVPREGHLEVAVIEELARLVQETALVAADVPDQIFAAFGRDVVGIVQQQGAAATGTVQFTTVDTAGYNIPKGTVVAVALTGDVRVFFVTTQTVTVNPGSTTASVAVVAEQPGEDGNGLGPGTVEVVDRLAFVDSAELTGTTAGGQDPEDDDAYRARLAAELRLSAPRPILPADFAVFARQTAGVARALVLDGYDPDTQTSDNERMVTVVPVDADGAASGQTAVDTLVADLEARREVNFVVNTDVPTYTAVTIVAEIVPADDVTPEQAVQDATDALERWISPASWGGGLRQPPVWEQTPTVPYLDAAAVLAQVPAVARVETLTIDGGTADVQLPGVAPLPAPLDDETTPTTVSVTAV